MFMSTVDVCLCVAGIDLLADDFELAHSIGGESDSAEDGGGGEFC